MLITRLINIETPPNNIVISFVGYANFLKISNQTLNSINWLVDGKTMKRLVRKKLKISTQTFCFDFSGIADEIFKSSIRSNFKILFIGGTKSEINKFLKIIRTKYPSLNCSGLNGYDELKKLKNISKNEFDIVVYGLGAPLQEETALNYKLKFKVSFTCGAFISQTAKKGGDYYPFIFQKLNLKWLYRIYKEPGHFMRLLYAYMKINTIKSKLEGIEHENHYYNAK